MSSKRQYNLRKRKYIVDPKELARFELMSEDEFISEAEAIMTIPDHYPILTRHNATCDDFSTDSPCPEESSAQNEPSVHIPWLVEKSLTEEEKKEQQEFRQAQLLYKMFMTGTMTVNVAPKKGITKIKPITNADNNVTGIKICFAIPFKSDTDFETELFGEKLIRAESHLVLSFNSSMIVLSNEETEQIKKMLNAKLTVKPIKQLVRNIMYEENTKEHITAMSINFCVPLSPDRDFETELFGEKIALITL